ncbi:MAG TPA: hypothetical protein VLK56_03195, partial [Solirubrobacterales bacterium]|nr:hypothetical protein [Solirubrobacterales bacterium]
APRPLEEANPMQNRVGRMLVRVKHSHEEKQKGASSQSTLSNKNLTAVVKAQANRGERRLNRDSQTKQRNRS